MHITALDGSGGYAFSVHASESSIANNTNEDRQPYQRRLACSASARPSDTSILFVSHGNEFDPKISTRST